MAGTDSQKARLILSGAFLRQLSNVTADTLPEGFPEDIRFHEALSLWAGKWIPKDQRELFDRLFSNQALLEAFAQGQTQISFDYTPPSDPSSRRLTMRLLSDPDGSVLCVSQVKKFVKKEAPKDRGPAEQAALQAITRSYLLFFSVDLNQPRIQFADLLRDEDHLAEGMEFPRPYEAFLRAVCGKYVLSSWSEEFLSVFSPENLKNALKDNRSILRHPFSGEDGSFRMDAFLPKDGENTAVCYLGLCRTEPESGSGLALTSQDGEAMHRALEDLQLEMQMERDETRKKHRRRCILLVLLTVIVGVIGGAILTRKVPEVSRVLDYVMPEPTEEVAVATPPPVTETEVVKPETVVSYVAFGTPVDFTAEIMENGTSRMNASAENYESLSFTVSVPEVLSPEWFETQYARRDYPLDGTEAAVHLLFRFTAGDNVTSLVPQEAFEIRITDAAGNLLESYQLMDQPMGGAYSTSLQPDTDTDLYKRYTYTEDARYLVLAYYQDTVRHEIRFALRYDDPNVDYPDLKQGDRGEVVLALKQRLAALGYLNERAAVGNQFTQETARAVSAAQEAFGLEQTGTADTTFLKKLFGEDVPASEDNNS